MRGTEPPTPEALAGRLGLDEAGFNLVGSLAIPRYDSLVSEAWRGAWKGAPARSALVVASGGRALFSAFAASPESTLPGDSLDAYTRRVVDRAAHRLGGAARSVYAFEKRGGVYADFVALAEASGLGAPSRLGLWLHPEFGPWMSIRAITRASHAFQGGPDRPRALRCDARRACVVGPDHADTTTAEAHHLRSAPAS